VKWYPGWFKSLSSRFLACRSARLLVLAGTDRLDKELMIGQMQGKFQMEVVPNVGHMLHEVCILCGFAHHVKLISISSVVGFLRPVPSKLTRTTRLVLPRYLPISGGEMSVW